MTKRLEAERERIRKASMRPRLIAVDDHGVAQVLLDMAARFNEATADRRG